MHPLDWQMDLEPYPGPCELATFQELMDLLAAAFRPTTDQLTKLLKAFEVVTPKSIPPKHGPRPKMTFDRRGRRTY